MISPRQELILRKVVEAHTATGLPVGSKALAADPDLDYGPSTIRNELAMLEEHGLLAHPHTSAGRVPTDAGHRFYVDRLLPAEPARPGRALELQLMRREVDEAMRVTTETLSQVTSLLAIVTAPPLDTATIRHVEVLLLQPQVLMVVVITSTGGVTKRDPHLRASPSTRAWPRGPPTSSTAAWPASGLGARTLHSRLTDPSLGATEQAFLDAAAARLHRAGRHGRGHPVRRRRRAAARRAPLPRPLADQRARCQVLERRVDAARRAARGAQRAATCSCASARENELPALHVARARRGRLRAAVAASSGPCR